MSNGKKLQGNRRHNRYPYHIYPTLGNFPKEDKDRLQGYYNRAPYNHNQDNNEEFVRPKDNFTQKVTSTVDKPVKKIE